MIFEGLTIPPVASINAAAGRTITAAGWREAIPVIYGQPRIGGLILNVLPAGIGATTFLVQVLWGEACDSISEVRLNGQALPVGATVTHYTGWQTTPDPALVAAFAAQGTTYSDTLTGFAYSVLSIPTRLFDGQLDITALVKGRAVYDPRIDSMPAWSKVTDTAVVGTPGSLPIGWGPGTGAAPINGLIREIVGFGVEDGITYVDVRWSGTATITASISVYSLPTVTSVPAIAGQVWKCASYVRLVSGSLLGLTNYRMQVDAYDAAQNLIGYDLTFTSAPTTAPLRSQLRTSNAYTLPATTAFVFGYAMMISHIAGQTIDVTLRFGWPMLWNVTAGNHPVSWSDNPALALADFLRHSEYGCNQHVDWSSVATAANACDTLVGGVEKRRTVSVAFTSPASVTDVAETLRAYAGCWLLPSGDGIKLLPDEPGSSVATYSHDSGNIASIAPLQYRDAGNSPTAVEVFYSDTSTIPWRQASRVATLPGAGSTLPMRLSAVQMPGITRSTQAYREAMERLLKLTTTQISTAIEVFDEGIKHEIGDIITVSHPIGLSARMFRISGPPEMTDRGRWRLPLVEYSNSVYNTEVLTDSDAPVEPVDVVPGPPDDVTGLTYTVEAGVVMLRWQDIASADRRDFEIREGASWASGTRLDRTAALSLRLPPRSAGAHTFWVAARDLFGNYSATPASVSVTINAPTQVTGLRSEVVDNNVLLYWNEATATQQIVGYEVRKGGTSWSAATPIGSNAISTFTAIFEQVSGAYTYRVAAVDVAGNYGPEATVSAYVNQPPDYTLKADWPSSFTGTRSNTVLAAGALYGPFSDTETWSQHFSTRGWSTPQDQINAGYPIYLTPSTTSGTYTEDFDYGSALPATTITVEPTTQTVTGSVTLTCQIQYKLNAGDSWTSAPAGFSALVSNFRYVRVVLTFSATAGNNLLKVSALRVKLSAKLRNDSGAGVASVGGTTVYFNYPFIAADTPIVQPQGSTPLIPVVIYSGGPNPTSFTVRLYNLSGTDVGGPFSWTVRGY